MTYQQWRKFGFVSRLAEIVAKGPGGNINTGNAIAGQQLSVASDAQRKASADYDQFKTLLQPLIGQQTALASGNREQALAAAMPVISQLSAGFGGAKQNLLNQMPAGAARDRALADLNTQMFTTIGGAQAGMVQQAPQTLAGVGSSLGNMSLQELGAALGGLQGASKTNTDVGQMEAMRQQSMLNFFGSLAGVAGGAFKPICWVAEAIYGLDDPRTLLIRAWINGPYAETHTGACVMLAYRAIGRQVAWLARHSRVLRIVLKPLFDQALGKAIDLFWSAFPVRPADC